MRIQLCWNGRINLTELLSTQNFEPARSCFWRIFNIPDQILKFFNIKIF